MTKNIDIIKQFSDSIRYSKNQQQQQHEKIPLQIETLNLRKNYF